MLERGRYGVEWTPPKPHDSSGLGRIVLVVVALALVSLAVTVVNRVRARWAEKAAESAPEVEAVPSPKVVAPSSEPAYQPPAATGSAKRPAKVRNLLMRLEVAEQQRDVEMAISTIEQIRGLPGSPAADLDDALARRLGVLNMRRLFVLKCAQWVTSVTVKKGQSAARIASEHGSTLASLAKLNGGHVETIRTGMTLSVLNHPRFSLIVRRRMGTADLQLNGKFFKRYDFISATGKIGAYEVTDTVRSLWPSVGVQFKSADRSELEALMPKGSSIILSEL